ncbi:class I SAM-dependent methyltransferase [Variovorax rhizosphaerae]|uniref:Class I SAM-dependent methyltransferase n=1 Tax=Variovorax rhizosphaerae TaxID=1836200 RepID=A0ABU8WPH0_9BURK
MTSRPPASNAGYGAEAATLAVRYESIAFEDVHRDVLHLFPARAADVLDVGAGTGRDAAALARRGHRVVAIEPTAELRAEGLRLHGAWPIEWVDDALPSLARLRQADRRFALILVTAVWMHLDEPERRAGMAALSGLLADGGQLVMSLRHGPVPQGRRMFDVSAAETVGLAGQLGLQCNHRGERTDTQGRPDVRWSVVGFIRPPGAS